MIGLAPPFLSRCTSANRPRLPKTLSRPCRLYRDESQSSGHLSTLSLIAIGFRTLNVSRATAIAVGSPHYRDRFQGPRSSRPLATACDPGFGLSIRCNLAGLGSRTFVPPSNHAAGSGACEATRRIPTPVRFFRHLPNV